MIKLLENLIVFNSPDKIEGLKERNKNRIKIFLAGTIDLGDSYNWQRTFIEKLKLTIEKNAINTTDFVIFNPRRDSWEGKPDDTNPMFVEQVNWELDRMEESDIIFMNLVKGSKSPVSLLELGLYARSKKLIVKCSPEFYRYGNVKMVCERYNVKLISNPTISLSTILEGYEIK